MSINFYYNVGSHVFLHRYFKLDGTAQGLPVCVLYADSLKNRFDWYKNSNGQYSNADISKGWNIRAFVRIY
jgi:hypothetical protein